jgi:hypothetical protein
MATEITLSFDVAKLLKIVQLKSLYTAGSMRDQAGTTQERNYALTDNEQDFFEIMLKTAADQVFTALQAYTRDVVSPYIVNQIDPATSRRYIIYKVAVGDNYNQANVRGLSNLLETAITSYILREWFRTINLSAVSQVYDSAFSTAMDTIKSNINYRKLAPKRPYSMF